MTRLLGCLLLFAALALLASPVLAQFSIFDKEVKIGADGQVYSGEDRIRPQWDILPDKYVFRYKIIEESEKELDGFRVRVILPATVRADQVKANIIAVHGVEGARIEPVDQNSFFAIADSVEFGGSITLTVDLPPSAIQFSTIQRAVVWLNGMTAVQWIIIALIMPIAVIIFFIYQVVTRWEDIRLKPSAQPMNVPPSQLPPALVGALIDGYVGVREIAATLVDLARRGYIDIIYKGEENFGFSQKRRWENDPQMQEFEKLLLRQIFGSEQSAVVSMNQQINQQLNAHLWSDDISRSVENIYSQMEQLGYFKKNLRQAHLFYRFVGMVMFFGSAAGLGLTLYIFSDRYFLAIPWVVGLLFAPFFNRLALLVPRRTPEGRAEAARWLAFRDYLSSSTPAYYAEEREQFEPYLAYAIVLGAEAQWTTRFSAMASTLPDWFFTEGRTIATYEELASTLFSIVGFVSRKFSFSRRPTAV